MSSHEKVDAQLGKELVEQLRLDYDKLSSEDEIKLAVKEIVDSLSVTYFAEDTDPTYDERVVN